MEAAKIGPDSQVNYQEDPRRRIILAPCVFCIRFTCKGKFDKFNYSSFFGICFFSKTTDKVCVCVCGRGEAERGCGKLCLPFEKFLATPLNNNNNRDNLKSGLCCVYIPDYVSSCNYTSCPVNSFMSCRGLAPSVLWNEVLQEKSGRKSGSASAL